MIDFWTLELLFRILLSSILGIIIGLERKSHNHFAGVKTHMIVCFSSCLVMIVSQYGFQDAVRFDAARLAAQMISGVGFIGAGIILKRQNMMIQGLTTSAGILGTCGIGLSIGGGMYLIGIFATLLYIVLFKFVGGLPWFQRNDLISYTFVIKGEELNDIVQKICRNASVISYDIGQDQNQNFTVMIMMKFDNVKKETEWENWLLDSYQILGFSKN